MQRLVAVCVAAALAACGGASSKPAPTASPSPGPTPTPSPSPTSTPSPTPTPTSTPTSTPTPTATPTPTQSPTPTPTVQPAPTSDLPAQLAPAVVARTVRLPGLPVRIAVDDDGTVRVAGNLVYGHGPGPYPEAVFSALVSPSGELTQRGVDRLGAKRGASDLGFDAAGGVVAAVGNPQVPLDEIVRVADGDGEAWSASAGGSVAAISVEPGGASYALVHTYVPHGQPNSSPTRVARLGPSGAVEWTRDVARGADAREIWGAAMARAAGGELLVVGYAPPADGSSPRAPFLATLSASGDVETFAPFAAPEDGIEEVAAAPAGGAYVGSFWNVQVSPGRYEQWATLASVAGDGTVRWRRVIGRISGLGWPSRLTVDAEGNAWFAITGTLVAYRPDGTLAAAAAIPDAWGVRSIAIRAGTTTLAGLTVDPSITTASGVEPSLIGFVWQLAPLPPR